MSRRTIPLIALLAGLGACNTADAPTALPLDGEAGLAKSGGGGGALYQVHFISTATASTTETVDGEITSEGFPTPGISISTSNPWKGIVVSGATLNLNNLTHGDTTSGGHCATSFALYSIEKQWANWDLATEPTRSYAGQWTGTVTIKSGYLAFDGDRVVGEGTPPGGGIHNVVTQQNPATLTAADDKSWFRQEVRNALFKFSGVSTPDGQDTVGSEFACVNYTIELRKVVP
jgi:hypothetical protein